jgi:uncharacterized membrane protein
VRARTDRTASVAARALLFLAALWATAIVVTPWLAAAAPRRSASLLAVAGIYHLGASVCHQRPERSFHAAGVQWPVCARCVGLYGAAGAAAWVILLVPRTVRAQTPAGRGRSAHVFMFAAAPTAVSWLAERAGILSPGNAARAALAVPLGLAVCWLLARAWRTAEDAWNLR